METGTKLVLFPVKIPFYRENREDRDTAVPVTQCNELCIVTPTTHTVVCRSPIGSENQPFRARQPNARDPGNKAAASAHGMG
jgi:hypothetical protein